MPSWWRSRFARRQPGSARTGSSWAWSDESCRAGFPTCPSSRSTTAGYGPWSSCSAIVQQRIARWLDVGGVRLADGTQLALANYPGCQQRSGFAGFARYGYARSQHRFIWGVRLVLVADRRGLPLGYTIVPANEKEYEPLADLLTGTPAEVVIADKGLWGRAYHQRLAADGVRLLTPDRTRTAANLGRERALATSRLVIESVFSNLKGQMRLEQHLAKTPAGLALRIAQRILALTIGILLNTLSGRPARALAAYDGR